MFRFCHFLSASFEDDLLELQTAVSWCVMYRVLIWSDPASIQQMMLSVKWYEDMMIYRKVQEILAEVTVINNQTNLSFSISDF